MIVLLQNLHKKKNCILGSNSTDLESKIKSIMMEVKQKPNFRFLSVANKEATDHAVNIMLVYNNFSAVCMGLVSHISVWPLCIQ